MTGKLEDKICPVCGGLLYADEATVPYILEKDIIVIVKNVPAEICGDCHEVFTTGVVTDEVMKLLSQLRSLKSEVSVVSYPALSLA